jgi:hypothetical protein
MLHILQRHPYNGVFPLVQNGIALFGNLQSIEKILPIFIALFQKVPQHAQIQRLPEPSWPGDQKHFRGGSDDIFDK